MANGEGTSGDPRPRTGARPPDERAPDSPTDAPVPPSADERPPSVARLAAVAGALVVLAMALVWPTRSSDGGFAGAPGGVTVPTDDDGHPVDLPPSQPATAVLLDASGLTMRPNPVRARIVDPVSGDDIIVPLAPDSTVDTRTGAIVPRSPTTTWPISPSTSVRTTTTTVHETTSVPEETTTTTEEPTTTTEEPTTTTEEPTTVPPDTIFYG